VVRGLISRSRIERHLHGAQLPPPLASEPAAMVIRR
jgi:hypothetical protein